uniref:Peptidyl-prolyl cis-trans isomerase n=1 Tax=Lynx canadensis TaxID=61383 RepID=A0A667FQH5_LYNCA
DSSINRKPNPLCCDVSTGGQEAGHMKIERFADVVPKTAKNFRQLCTGNFGRVPWLKKDGDFMIQGGDFANGDGTGVTMASIHRGPFAGEIFNLDTAPGLPSRQTNVPTGPNSKPKLPVVTSQCREMRCRGK